MVADIAYDRLGANARTKVDWASTMIRFKGQAYNAINLATWADTIKHSKGDPFSGDFANWHFIDLGLKSGDVDLIANPPPLTITDGDIVTALRHCESVIKGEHDPLIPSEAVAIALMWHLMGDLHQPLHCTTDYYPQPHAGGQMTDRGGNSINVLNVSARYTDFHALWDGVLECTYDKQGGKFVIPSEPDPFTVSPENATLRADVDEIVGANAIPSTAMAGEYADWAKETHALGIQAYTNLGQDFTQPSITVTRAYVANAQSVARRQILLAGLRLASVLNRLYP